MMWKLAENNIRYFYHWCVNCSSQIGYVVGNNKYTNGHKIAN